MFYTINNIKSLEDMIKFWKTPTSPLKKKKIKTGKKPVSLFLKLTGFTWHFKIEMHFTIFVDLPKTETIPINRDKTYWIIQQKSLLGHSALLYLFNFEDFKKNCLINTGRTNREQLWTSELRRKIIKCCKQKSVIWYWDRRQF